VAVKKLIPILDSGAKLQQAKTNYQATTPEGCEQMLGVSTNAATLE